MSGIRTIHSTCVLWHHQMNPCRLRFRFHPVISQCHFLHWQREILTTDLPFANIESIYISDINKQHDSSKQFFADTSICRLEEVHP